MKFRIVKRHVFTKGKDYWFIQYKTLFWWKNVTCDMIREAGFSMTDGSLDYTLIDPGFLLSHRIGFSYDTAIRVATQMKNIASQIKNIAHPIPIYDTFGKINTSIIIDDTENANGVRSV